MTKTLLRMLVGPVFLTLSFSQPGFTQPSDDLKAVQKEIQALKKGQKSIQRELKSIKDLLRRQARQPRGRQGPPPFQPVVVDLGDDPFKGDKNAKVTLIDFSDYQ